MLFPSWAKKFLVVLISVTLIFKEQLIDLVTNIFDTIMESAGEV